MTFFYALLRNSKRTFAAANKFQTEIVYIIVVSGNWTWYDTINTIEGYDKEKNTIKKRTEIVHSTLMN